MLERLKQEVCRASQGLVKNGLVILTEGNVSAISDDRKYVVIKPSGMACDDVKEEDMVVVNLAGELVEGKLNPSVDTAIHLEIYRAFKQIKTVIHTHSFYATVFAQRRETIPCLGTTHADAFYGEIPLTRELTREEIKNGYEKNTGKVINEVLNVDIPAVLVPGHGAFVFGTSAGEALNHAIVLEKVAKMALFTGSRTPISEALLDKHYRRKHGQSRYYGQNQKPANKREGTR
jgi:L-ribulose-5-phosphate 4-epimerase